jgi:transcriptional regulator with XRE-family HTH domain
VLYNFASEIVRNLQTNLIFPERLKNVREGLHLTQTQLGDRYGVHFNYISMLETGSREFPKKWQSRVLELEAELSQIHTPVINALPLRPEFRGEITPLETNKDLVHAIATRTLQEEPLPTVTLARAMRDLQSLNEVDPNTAHIVMDMISAFLDQAKKDKKAGIPLSQ